MAKGPIMTYSVKRLIAQVHLEHTDWRAKEIQSEVNACLRRANPHINPDWPGLSSVQKELANIRKRNEERSPESKEQDKPWCVLDIAKHPIPPETLPVVLDAWGRELLKDVALSIREVLWIARLWYVLKDTANEIRLHGKLVTELIKGDDRERIIWWAKWYALDELIYEQIGQYPHKLSEMWLCWLADALLYESKTGNADLSEKAEEEFKKRPIPHYQSVFIGVEKAIFRKEKEAQDER